MRDPAKMAQQTWEIETDHSAANLVRLRHSKPFKVQGVADGQLHTN